VKLKEQPEDFVVEEIALGGEVLEVGKSYAFDAQPKGSHLLFVLEKRNWDSIGAMKEIGRRLHASERRLGFAGTKDRRAISAQLCSAQGFTREELESLQIKDMVIKPLRYGSEVKLGDLEGNRFTIVVREIDPNVKAPASVANLFGEQRFGTLRPITHLVGKAIVEEDAKKAVDTYLFKWFEAEPEEEKKARQRLEKERDYAKALEYYPMRMTYERTLLGHLARKPDDYCGALRDLPRKLLVMFVHAYQSDLFNRVVEERRKLGFEPIEGDILEEGIPTAPLYGHDSQLAAGKQGEIEKRVLDAEWLELKQFRLHKLRELSSAGLRRAMVVKVRGFHVLEKGVDWVKVRFSLPKGCYATTVLAEMFGSR
jgi:tRNA pseudouridine13 synthase